MKKMFASLNLKARAVLVTAGILLLALVFNTLVNISVTTARYREALIGRAAAVADGMRKDINKAIGFGIPLHALDGMSARLRGMLEADQDLADVMIMDTQGKVLFASEPNLENTVLSDEVSRKAAAAVDTLVLYHQSGGEGHYEQAFPIKGTDGKKAGVLRLSIKEGAVKRQTQSLLLWSLLVALVSFVIAVVLVYFFMDRSIARPITEMAATASLVAAGDLTQEVAARGESEIAALSGAINTMSSNLREMLSKIKATADGVAEAMQLMTDATVKMSQGARIQQEATEQTAMTVNEMVASIKGVAENSAEMSRTSLEASSSAMEMMASIAEVATNSTALATSVEDTAASIAQMIASIKQVSENTDALSSSAEQTSSAITEMSASVKEVEQRAIESTRLAEKVSHDASDRGMTAAAEAIKGMRNIKGTVEASAEVVNRLGKRSQEIGQILKVIDEVTDQTSLLALNAAILAAQAGEHGKGFAVVAEEIKELAERTAASTQEISSLIAAVREDTAESVQAMSRGLKAVDAGVALVNVTHEVLEQVADSSRQSADMARAIEKTTAEQAKGVAQITETSVSIAGQIEQIARALQEQRKGSEQISNAVEGMCNISIQVITATREQTSNSKQIAVAVENVTAQAAQTARSTMEQSLGVQQISEAISRIQAITQDTVDVSIEMDMAVQTLKAKSESLLAEIEGFKFS